MTRLDIEKIVEDKILENMLRDEALIEQGNQFIQKMKKRSSALLEKAIRLSTLQKDTESEMKKMPKR